MTKVIKMTPDPASIEAALRELEAYRSWLIRKANELRNRVAELISERAQTGFNGAVAEDDVAAGMRMASVAVSFEPRGDVTIVVAQGEDAVWVEFGAGVYYNGPKGSQPNPYAAHLGWSIGTYGQGKGSRKTWAYQSDDGIVFTHGTPAAMPLYRAVSEMRQDLIKTAQEVFSS